MTKPNPRTRPAASLLILLALLLALPPAPLHALQVTGLYSERVAVANDSDAERNRAVRAALEAVVLKVTGEPRWQDHPAVRNALSNAQRYVEAIAYSSETVPLAAAEAPASDSPAESTATADEPAAADASDPTLADAGAPTPPATREQRYVTVDFARTLIDEMLAAADIPVWDANRPSVLVWLVLQNSVGERQMLSDDSNPEIMALMREFAARRGLPIIFPVLDFADRRNLNENQVWAFEEEPIRQASQRYGADSILAARLHFTAGGELVGLSQFIFNDEIQVFDGLSRELRDYVYAPLNRITSYLAAYYAVTPESLTVSRVPLRVMGVDDLEAYGALIDYLSNLGLVERVVVVGLEGALLELQVSVLGSEQQLRELIALDRDLLPVTEARDVTGPSFQYRWTR